MDEEELERERLSTGIRVALARIDRATTKLDLCRRLGCTPTTLDRWIHGAARPSERNLARIARLSGLTQEEIRNCGIPEERPELQGYYEYTIRKAD